MQYLYIDVVMQVQQWSRWTSGISAEVAMAVIGQNNASVIGGVLLQQSQWLQLLLVPRLYHYYSCGSSSSFPPTSVVVAIAVVPPTLSVKVVCLLPVSRLRHLWPVGSCTCWRRDGGQQEYFQVDTSLVQSWYRTRPSVIILLYTNRTDIGPLCCVCLDICCLDYHI